MRTKIEAPYSWAFLEEFFFPDSSDWNAVITLAAAFRRFNEAYLSTVRALVARWDDALHGVGGDPLRENWARFRPLRRSREEDWSDWLAYLLESSRTGRRTAVERTGAHRTLPLGSKVPGDEPAQRPVGPGDDQRPGAVPLPPRDRPVLRRGPRPRYGPPRRGQGADRAHRVLSPGAES
jgi:hypothetical protein